ncbi:hypothetical protein BCAH820_5560 [Bacillus cereus AH820]|uniref:Uncharacterized protein n=1 Tax=Bacillus cereus (strain AH820) TaxID=405535 RepID=B7JII1_BACC0|nr:hypothetical protein BCAH820_5560 [Bacillus cereus AH820]QBZ28463.1 hypothetical protein FORC085_5414 [Bacillus cereus]
MNVYGRWKGYFHKYGTEIDKGGFTDSDFMMVVPSWTTGHKE